MLNTIARNWWALALRGLAAVLFGLLTFFVPGVTLVTLVLLFGAYALLDGLFNVLVFFRVASHHWALLIEGVIGIIAGVLTFAWHAITAIALLYVIAFWAIFTGVFEIVAGIRLRKVIANEWLLLLMGVLSALFGLLILFAPGAGALAIVLWIGAYAPIHSTMANAPAPGANRINKPNSAERTPIKSRSHSFAITLRRRMPATISKTPVKIAQNAIT